MSKRLVFQAIKMPSKSNANKDAMEKSTPKKVDTEEPSTSKRKSNDTPKKESNAKSPKLDFTVAIPHKNNYGQVAFTDWAAFRPNKTPAEVLQAGSFGGTYFRPIYSSVTKKKYGTEVWQELPEDWLKGLSVENQVASPIYDKDVNKYKVKCGASLEEWENSGWMNVQDPYGWFQWYCRFYQGRRSEDDERQVGRWQRCCGEKGRWKQNLISKIVKAGAKYDDFKVSPVVRQTLLHWAYELTEKDFKEGAKRVKK